MHNEILFLSAGYASPERDFGPPTDMVLFYHIINNMSNWVPSSPSKNGNSRRDLDTQLSNSSPRSSSLGLLGLTDYVFQFPKKYPA